MTIVNYNGLTKAQVLAALYNAAAPQGMGFMRAQNSAATMTVEQAEELLKVQQHFDYLAGRPLKLNLSANTETFDAWGFDRDNGGEGTAERIIELVRQSGDINPASSQNRRYDNTHLKAHEAMQFASASSTMEDGVVTLGADEYSADLERAVDRTIDNLNNE